MTKCLVCCMKHEIRCQSMIESSSIEISPFRYAKSGISPAPNASVGDGKRTRSTVQSKKVEYSMFMVVWEKDARRLVLSILSGPGWTP